MKKNKGITLIALVITIIVLLILAGVAISMLSGENGILKKATEAKSRSDRAKIDETDSLEGLEDLINESTESVSSINNIGEEATEKNIRLKDSNGDTMVLPAGFRIKPDSPKVIKRGVVVLAPDDSEFVWVPVKDISKMYGIDSEGKKVGKLYEFNTTGYTNRSWTETDGVVKWGNNNGVWGPYIEPSYLSSTSAGDAIVGDSTKGVELLKSIIGLKEENGDILTQWKTNLQSEFDEMIKYVRKNKGFYIGRYETSLNTENQNAQSISGVSSATSAVSSANTWYGLYQKEKEYSEKNNLTNVVGSSMIWGSQYDQMMMWMQGNGIDVTSYTPTNLEGVVASKNKSRKTGTEPKDKLNNIYDLLGNGEEWTLESSSPTSRTGRGGTYRTGYTGDDSTSASCYSAGQNPYTIYDKFSSRITLYVK